MVRQSWWLDELTIPMNAIDQTMNQPTVTIKLVKPRIVISAVHLIAQRAVYRFVAAKGMRFQLYIVFQVAKVCERQETINLWAGRD